MGRIPASELERVKRETDLADLVRGSGVELARRGRDLVGLCPFHEDREPSLVVTPSKGLWHCLGACDAGGTVIDWVMCRDGVSFRHAAELLLGGSAEELGTVLEDLGLDPSAPTGELLGRIASFYNETLKGAPEARSYLEGRGLGDRRLVDVFELGYANRTLCYRLPPGRLKAGAAIRGRLQELGVLRESGHEHLTGSVVVPIRDGSGEMVQLYGRKIRDDLRKGTPAHLYLPGPLRGIWNAAALETHAEIILCESLLDALTFWAAGHENVTTAFGTNGLTDELEAALEGHEIERVLIAYDRDAAGDRGAEKAAERLGPRGIECWRIRFPRGLDANEYAREVRPAKKSLGVAIRGAVWLGTGPPPGEPASRDASPPISGSRDPAGDRTPKDPVSEPAAPEPAASSLVASSSTAADAPAAAAPAASPVAATAALPTLPLEVGAEEVTASVDDRAYRVRGLEKNGSPDLMRVNLLVRRGEAVHVDTLDLYQARQRKAFVTQAAGELSVGKKLLTRDLGRLLLALERVQADRLRGALDPEPNVPALTEAERREALTLLEDPDLLGRILADFERAGVVGEETNKLVGYLAAVSRKLAEPLAVVIQSSSAAGKTALMDAVLSFVPPEDRVRYSALTGQSLFYMEGTRLKHRVLAVVEEEGAERASYALKLLQSEGELTIASTGKDPDTGKLVTHEYRVEGPVMLFLTTTAVELDEELLNRALVLAVDEDRSQTRRVHRAQRERRTLEGLLARKRREAVVRVHRNAQRLLRPLAVVNPYAPDLTFLDTRTRTRRDHQKYLTLIDAVALLHQHQREVKTVERGGVTVEYVEVEPSDIAVANRLAGEVLGRSLDELPPQTRRVLELLHEWLDDRDDHPDSERHDHEPGPDVPGARARPRFTAREVREALGLGPTQTKVHLARLVDLEYVAACRRGPGLPYTYELLYRGEGETGTPFLPGLVDVDGLPARPHRLPLEMDPYDPDRSGSSGGWSGRMAGWSGGGRPPVCARSGGGRAAGIAPNRLNDAASGPERPPGPENATRDDARRSHVPAGRNGTGP